MKPTMYAGEEFFLLELRPDWSSRVRVSLSRPVHIEAGLTGREDRRFVGDTVRITQDFRVIALGDDARNLELWLASLTTEQVAVPFWPGLRDAVSLDPAFSSQLSIAFAPDFSRSEVFEGRPPVWARPVGYVAPLVFGRIKSRTMEWDSPTQVSVRVSHVEESGEDRAVTVIGRTFTPGPHHEPATKDVRAMFPARLNYDRPGQTAELSVSRAEVGFGRTPEESTWAPPDRRFSVEAVADGRDESARLVAFFAQCSSAVPFWVPSNAEEFTIGRDIIAGQRIIPAAGHGLESGDWLAFSRGGAAVAFSKVAAVTPSAIELATAPGALPRGETLVTRLALCRFESDRLTIDFDAPDVATARFDLRELKAETRFPNGEEDGFTIGAADSRVWLYRITTWNDEEKWTSHESPVDSQAGRFYPARITNGELRFDSDLSRNSLTVSVGLTVSPIVRALLTRSVSGPTRIEVTEARRIGGQASFPFVVFTGEVTEASLSENTVELSCRPWGNLLDRPLPRVRVQATCNNSLFDPGCRLAKADWEFAGVVTAPGSPGYPFAFGLSGLSRVTGATPAYSENWFAGGWIEFPRDRVAIRASSIPAAGLVTLTLARDPRPFPEAGDPVALFPGCNGLIGTCENVFGNRNNFMGHPFIPAANPSLVKLSSGFNGGKK